MMLTPTPTKTARIHKHRKVEGREGYMHKSCNYFSCGEYILAHNRLDEDSLGMNRIPQHTVLQVHLLRAKSTI
jgi:hypothetical protein